MPNGNGVKAWGVALFLAGVVVAGLAGVVRGDWIGNSAAEHVLTEVTRAHDKDLAYMKEDLKRIEKKIDELLRIQR